MNELIYDLWLKFINNELLFAGVIQTACKAQRNACARIYNKHYGNSEHYDECCGLEIFTAEIERCNYE